jgi:hypothetical protein
MKVAIITTVLLALGSASPIQGGIAALHPPQDPTTADSPAVATTSNKSSALLARNEQSDEELDYGTRFFKTIFMLLHASLVAEEMDRAFERWTKIQKKKLKKLKADHERKMMLGPKKEY